MEWDNACVFCWLERALWKTVALDAERARDGWSEERRAEPEAWRLRHAIEVALIDDGLPCESHSTSLGRLHRALVQLPLTQKVGSDATAYREIIEGRIAAYSTMFERMAESAEARAERESLTKLPVCIEHEQPECPYCDEYAGVER